MHRRHRCTNIYEVDEARREDSFPLVSVTANEDKRLDGKQ